MLLHLIKALLNELVLHIMHKETIANLVTCYLAKINMLNNNYTLPSHNRLFLSLYKEQNYFYFMVLNYREKRKNIENNYHIDLTR